MSTTTYPLMMTATPDTAPSRWLWLVKWLLLIPHYFLLVFLWIAFFVITVLAFFAILFTGRYPRTLFDFNVGVLRWTWRVGFYGYEALGTDRYPPFTLADVADYPTHLEVEYPATLSRGLVLVKWWLLTIPQYIVVGIFVGGGVYAVGAAGSDDGSWVWAGGLIGIVVLVAAVVLLFTGSYPRSIFDLVVGLNRWVLRVAAYASLMTDRYPPFRLDMGGEEPAGPTSTPSGPSRPPEPLTAAVPEPQPRVERREGWTPARVTALVAGCVVMVLAWGFGAAGAALLFADTAMRDDDGFLMTSSESFDSATYALASDNLQLHVEGIDDAVPRSVIGDVRLSVASASDAGVFVGIGRTEDVAGYLRGVGHDTVVDVEGPPGDATPRYRESPGGPPAAVPTGVTFWEEQTSGTGTQVLTWEPRSGDWTVVVMNPGGGAGVDVDVKAGATVPVLSWGAGALIVLAVLGIAFALMLILLATRAAKAYAARPMIPAG